MGKKQDIISIAHAVALISVHKIVLHHTNKPESTAHLKNEIDGYSVEGFDKAQKHNWTQEELDEIQRASIRDTKNRMLKKYSDIHVTDSEIQEFVVDTLQDLLLK